MTMLDTKNKDSSLREPSSRIPGNIKKEYQSFVKDLLANVHVSLASVSTSVPSKGNAVIYIDASSLSLCDIGLINDLGKSLQQKTGRIGNEPPTLLYCREDTRITIKIDLLECTDHQVE